VCVCSIHAFCSAVGLCIMGRAEAEILKNGFWVMVRLRKDLECPVEVLVLLR
jgi:hypothetical protein